MGPSLVLKNWSLLPRFFCGRSCFPLLPVASRCPDCPPSPQCVALLCFAFVLRCFALLCFVLLCFALFCFVLLGYALFCIALFCFTLFCFALHCFALVCFALLILQTFTKLYKVLQFFLLSVWGRCQYNVSLSACDSAPTMLQKQGAMASLARLAAATSDPQDFAHVAPSFGAYIRFPLHEFATSRHEKVGLPNWSHVSEPLGSACILTHLGRILIPTVEQPWTAHLFGAIWNSFGLECVLWSSLK